MAVSVNVDFAGFYDLFKTIGDSANGCAAAALYEGAAIMADAINEHVASLATEEWRFVNPGDQPRLISPMEKAALMSSTQAGIARFGKSGDGVETSVSFSSLAGYATINGTTVPVPVLARAVNAGTSWRRKQPFIRQAFQAAKGKAESKIAAELETRLQKAIDKL